jgi:hypothetical protein
MTFNATELLARLGYDLDAAQVEGHATDHNGIKCISLSLVRPATPWRAEVRLDPARDMLPVFLSERHQGVLTHQLSMEHAKDDHGQWTVAQWVDLHYDSVGQIDETAVGRVVHCTVNQPVAEGLFTLTMPRGTHVSEKKDDATQYYIVDESGK